MTITDRDKKLLLILIALVVVAGYWFLALTPKREEAARAADELAEQEARRDAAVARVAELEAARSSYAADYATVVRLGKAIPSAVDTASLIVQLQRAARGTEIEFDRIAAGERSEGTSTGDTAATSSTTGSEPSSPADAGQSDSEGSASATEPTEGTTAPPDGESATGTSDGSSGSGGPVGGGAGEGGAGRQAPGLESVPLEFEFTGSFFDLADFFHELKRFVKVAGDEVEVRGRLITIDGLVLRSDEESFPNLIAEVQATVYLTPKSEGPTVGATSAGPGGSVPATGRSVGDPSETPPPATVSR